VRFRHPAASVWQPNSKSHSLIRHIQQAGLFERPIWRIRQPCCPRNSASAKITGYQGTADAVYQNLDILREADPDFVLVLAGDHVYKMDYGKLLAFHVEKKADMTVACLEVPLADATAFGVMGVDENSRVVKFDEKPSHPAPIPASRINRWPAWDLCVQCALSLRTVDPRCR